MPRPPDRPPPQNEAARRSRDGEGRPEHFGGRNTASLKPHKRRRQDARYRLSPRAVQIAARFLAPRQRGGAR